MTATCLWTGVSMAVALPDADAPVDPARRASISTADAVQPSADPARQSRIEPPRIIRMSEIPLRRATITPDRAAIDVRRTKEARVIRPEAAKPEVRTVARTRASDLPASIPRLDRERFRRMIAEYQRGGVPADSLLHSTIVVAGGEIDLADVNRYANPRRALEAQGIPVVRAGNEEPEESASAPIPIPEAKR